MGVSKRIKEARQNLELTQAQLAEMLNITKGAVGNYENGTSHPKEPILLKLMEVLNVDANYLFQDVVKIKTSSPLTKNEQNLLNNYNQLNDNGKQKASDYVEDLAGNRKYLKNTYTEERVELSKELA